MPDTAEVRTALSVALLVLAVQVGAQGTQHLLPAACCGKVACRLQCKSCVRFPCTANTFGREAAEVSLDVPGLAANRLTDHFALIHPNLKQYRVLC